MSLSLQMCDETHSASEMSRVDEYAKEYVHRAYNHAILHLFSDSLWTVYVASESKINYP